jgi:4-hydroxy-tetrahydrodipicolinate synthase
MNQQIFSGTGVALVTPFSNGKVDYPALERIINHVIEGGVDYLVSLGTTGEAITLSREECRAVLDFTIKINNGRLPIVAGHFGSNRTDYLVERIKEFDFTGVDAVLSSSPSYSKPSQEGIFQHYMKIEEVCPKPIIIYNVPGRTCSNISAETTIRLAEASPKFIGVKEASGDIVQGSKIIKGAPEGFLVLSGDDPTALALISCGGHGVISVIANAFPTQFSGMIRALSKNDSTTAKSVNLQLLDIHQWLYVDGNPSGIKAALEILGLCSKEVRLPLVPIQERNYRNLKMEIEKALAGIKSTAFNIKS